MVKFVMWLCVLYVVFLICGVINIFESCSSLWFVGSGSGFVMFSVVYVIFLCFSVLYSVFVFINFLCVVFIKYVLFFMVLNFVFLNMFLFWFESGIKYMI